MTKVFKNSTPPAATNPGRGKSTAELVRSANKFRDNYNPLRSLVISRVVVILEQAERGDFAELELTLRKIEKRYPVLKALKTRRLAALEKLDWDIKVVGDLPDGYTDADAEAQENFLRSRYELLENLTEAVGQLELAEFRGFTILQKHRYADGENDGAVRELHWLPQWTWSRDGDFGDFFYNADSKFGIGGAGCASALGEANRLGGAELPLEDFIKAECDTPLYEIALIAFVNWAMGRKDYAAFVEIFGLPSAIVVMPANIPIGKEEEYRAAAEKVADGVSGALPNGSEAKFPGDSVRGVAPFKEFCDAQDSDVVLAGTGGLLTMLSMPTGIGGGASEQHADAFGDIAQASARRINAIFQRQFDKVELAAEFPGQPCLVYFELAAQDEDDATAVVDRVVKLDGIGLKTEAEEVSEKTGLKLHRAEVAAAVPQNEPVDPVLQRQIAYAKWKREFADGATDAPAPAGGADGIIANRDESGGRWVTLNGTPVLLKDGESVKEAADRVFHSEKKDVRPKRKTDNLKGQNERAAKPAGQGNDQSARPSSNQENGGRNEQGKGRTTTDVIGRSPGADSEDSDGLAASFKAQKSDLEKLHASGQATVNPNSSRIIGQGGEHLVELSADGSRVIKHTKGEFGFALAGRDAPNGSYVQLRQATPQEYVNRVHLHNQVFGDDTRVEGVSKAWSDDVGLVVSQRAIKGSEPTQKEAYDYMQSHGFVRVRNDAIVNDHLENKSSVWYHPSSGIVATDVKPDNFKKTADGQIVSVDTIVQHAKPGSALARAMKFGTSGTMKNRGAAENPPAFAAALAAKLDPVSELLNRITQIKDDAQMIATLQNFLARADSLSALVTADVRRAAAALEQTTAPALAAGLAGKAP